MDTTEWLQFVSVPSDSGQGTPCTDRSISDKTLVTAPTPQIPTPPLSNQGSPTEEHIEANTVVSVSTTFFPGASLGPLPPDLIFLSSDAVFFYVHGHQVLGASENGFKSLLPPKPNKAREDIGPIISLPENSCVLNVLLHTVYHMHCTHYSPSIDILIAAVDAMHNYGIPVTKYIAIGTPLYQLILALAPVAPIELYSLAATYDLYDLAVPISSHLLAYPLPNITDELAERIGPVYLKRMFFLHLGRIDALKRLLLPPPHPHAPTPDCDFIEQKKLTRAWALASAYLAWDARPDLSTSSMEAALGPLGEHLTCELCQTTLRDRIKQLIIQWSVVKVLFTSIPLHVV
ncbi:hypothetical protein NLI96_g10150 [Meripilus lineatus]|uniref:BTB domain-containing protein n=1 Tax=Meripilus lineatus TaxID=2056292 RepID=A0AAD5UVM9_9APHY|nr:hypothetical protein NLI96_g10150 [Physisporinus lineatus]